MPVYLGSQPVADLPFQETVYNGAGEVCFERDIFASVVPAQCAVTGDPDIGEWRFAIYRQTDGRNGYHAENTPEGYRISCVSVWSGDVASGSGKLRVTPQNINSPMPYYINMYVTHNDTGRACYYSFTNKGGGNGVFPTGDYDAVQMATYQFSGYEYLPEISIGCGMPVGTGFTIVRVELIAGIAPEGST